MKIIKTLTLHNARALLDCRRREHGPPVKNYGIPFVVHVHAIANGRFHRGNSAATRSDRQFSGSERWRGITVLRLPSADRVTGGDRFSTLAGHPRFIVLVERRVTPISVLFWHPREAPYQLRADRRSCCWSYCIYRYCCTTSSGY